MKKYGVIYWFKTAAGGDRQRGVAIFLAMIMLTLILSLALGVNTLLISQIKTMRDAGNSVIAFYAAESGIEWALKNIDVTDWTVYETTPKEYFLVLNNNSNNDIGIDATYDVYTIDPGGANPGQCGADADFCVKSVGVYKGTRRVIQIQL